VGAGLADESVFATELGAVVAGRRPGRAAPEEITLFKSVGNAVQDVVVARHAVDEARRLGRGRQVDLD
jgi:ornithine cyclodeaminase